jgi:hypothetical protein
MTVMTINAENARTDALDARRQELLTVKEYAALIRQHEWSIYRRIREQRQAGVVRCGRRVRIDIALAERPA